MTGKAFEGPISLTGTTVLYTGGTIGAAGAPLAPMGAARFRALAEAAGLAPGCRWDWTEPAIDSTEATPADWARIAGHVLAAPGPVVILHGTDSMAWSAAALAVLLTEIGEDGAPAARHGAPVVLTGSQHPLFDGDAVAHGSDAPDNLATALGVTPPPGVWLAFNGALMPGARVMKADTTALAAFETPNGGGEPPAMPPALPPALPCATPERLADQLAALAPHLGRRMVLPVIAAPNGAGAQAEALAAAIDALGDRLGAIHLLGFGLGNMPDATHLGPVLERAAARGVLLLVGTHVPHGRVDPGLYAAGHWLDRLGALPAGDMTVAAAQAKLHLALALQAARDWSGETVRAFLEIPIAGELTLA